MIVRQNIMRAFLVLIVLTLGISISAADRPLYDQARELYRQGPTKGPEVVRLLREHIAASPQDLDAVSLLAITLFGMEKAEEALPVIERAIALAGEQKEIRPKMVMLKARTLYELNRHCECRRVLEAYWAFWQDSPELKELYDWYYPRVQDAKEESGANPARWNGGRGPAFQTESEGRPSSVSLE